MNDPHGRDCTACAYFAPEDETNTIGECRRNAPFPRAMAGGPDSDLEAYWPIVVSGEWCGEFLRDRGNKNQKDNNA